MKKLLVIGLAVLMVIGLATKGMADTTVHVDWSSPNPDIQASLHQTGTVWANVYGLGDTATSSANGEINLSGGGGTETAWQTASFNDMTTYSSSVNAYGDEGSGDPSVWWRYVEGYQPGFSEGWHTFQGFTVTEVTSGTVTQEASAIRNSRGVEGGQTYSATGADLVVAGGSVTHEDWKWRGESYVEYVGNAEGDVIGSQASIASYQGGEYHTGFGAGISGTEGDTYFGFSTNSPNPANAQYDITSLETFHTVIVGSGFSVVGEAHTWVEQVDPDDDPWDANFNWIELSP